MNSSNYLSLAPKSPIRIGEAKPNFLFLPTSDFIPGSVMRGALAEYLISQGRKSEIKQFITDMRFGFLYPSKSPASLSLHQPSTSLTCKTHGGFKSKGGAHGVSDLLLAMIAYEELRNTHKAKFPVPFAFTCQECGSRMDRSSKLYVKEKSYEEVKVQRISQTKVAVNRRRKTAETGMLYSITALRPNMFLVGKVSGDTKKFREVLEALNSVGIGAHTTRGYGNVEAKEEQVKIEELEKRLQSFNEKLREVWSDVLSISMNKNELPKEPLFTYFSIDLLSPAILKSNGVPTLKLFLNLNGEVREPILFSASPVFIGGWSTAWGLPKETTYGAGIGCTYAFRVKESISEISHRLDRIEYEGIGDRRDEGYGDVLVCHPFHREVIPV